VEGGGAVLASVDALSDQMQQIGRELRLVAIAAGVCVGVGSSTVRDDQSFQHGDYSQLTSAYRRPTAPDCL
jgi:hypothetical protein